MDTLIIERKNKDPSETLFIINFPHIVGDVPTTMGVKVTLTWEQFKELYNCVKNKLSWSCPRCGKMLHNYRRSELDWDYKVCEYCGWTEND
jgi:predicted RNA-binding Zn-ribbon protein involved in translation (DUF1610 family)